MDSVTRKLLYKSSVLAILVYTVSQKNCAPFICRLTVTLANVRRCQNQKLLLHKTV